MDQNTRQPFDTGFNDPVSLRGIHDAYSLQAFFQRTFDLSIFGIHLLSCWSYCGLLFRGSDTGGESKTTRIISRALWIFLLNNIQIDSRIGPHVLIGMMVLLLIPLQFILGYLHHRASSSSLENPMMRKSHAWAGRLLVFGGCVNAIMYVTFALCSARRRNICRKVANQLLQWSMARRSICN